MTERTQLWIMRVASVLALVLLPLACTIMAVLVVGAPKGDNFPTAAFLGFGLALVASFPIARRTIFARVDRLGLARRVLLGLVAFDILPFVLGFVVKYCIGVA